MIVLGVPTAGEALGALFFIGSSRFVSFWEYGVETIFV